MQVQYSTYFFNLLAAAALVSCSAYDLGDEKVQEIAVDAANPTWANGIGALVAAKCVNCHTATPSDFVPADVPDTLHQPRNDIASQAFFDANTSSQGFPAHAYARIFMDTKDPMPPNFATPLTANETAALKNYFANLGITTESMCADGTTDLAYADVQPIIASTCALAGCHGAGSTLRKPLSTFAEVKATRYNNIAYLATGFMPLGNATYVDSEQGQRLLTWLCHGTDLD